MTTGIAPCLLASSTTGAGGNGLFSGGLGEVLSADLGTRLSCPVKSFKVSTFVIMLVGMLGVSCSKPP